MNDTPNAVTLTSLEEILSKLEREVNLSMELSDSIEKKVNQIFSHGESSEAPDSSVKQEEPYTFTQKAFSKLQRLSNSNNRLERIFVLLNEII